MICKHYFTLNSASKPSLYDVPDKDNLAQTGTFGVAL